MEKVMMDVMYEIPSEDNVAKCIITKEAVEGTEEPKLIYREAMPKKKVTHNLLGKGSDEIA